jgi:urease accessory protein
MQRRLGTAALAATLAFSASPSFAHTGAALQGGFASGFMHPLTGPDHLLAMVSVGIWGAFLGRPLIVALPVIFPTVMAVGGVMGMLGVPMPPIEIGVGLSVLILGLAIAAAFRAPVWAASILVAVFAIFHGYAHGQELPVAADPVGYSMGFVLATGLLHVVGIGIGMIKDLPRGAVATRSLGGLIALAGAYFLYAAVAA